MHEFRCEQCGTLLAKEDVEIGKVEVKCYRCNYINTFEKQSRVINRLLDSVVSAEI